MTNITQKVPVRRVRGLRPLMLAAATLALTGCMGAETTGTGAARYQYIAPNQMIPADIVERAFRAGVGPDAVVMQVIPGSEGWCWYYRTPAGGYASLDQCVG